MANTNERPYVQNLRTTKTTPPQPSDNIEVHDGEIIVGMNEVFPKLFIKKEDGEYEEFVGLSELLNAELATNRALIDLKNRLDHMDRIVGYGIAGESITEYIVRHDSGATMNHRLITAGVDGN